MSLSLIASSEAVMSLSFTFGKRAEGDTILIGGLQACASRPTERLRQLTHELHGIQPRLLLVHALRVMGPHLNMTRMEAVSARNHVFCSVRYRWKKTVHLAYEELWEMIAGIPRDDGNYDIPIVAVRKPLASYPSRKRGEYKRRFDLLDGMAAQVAGALIGSVEPIVNAATGNS